MGGGGASGGRVGVVAQPWREATRRALYGPDGFYRAAAGPGAHFRTSVHASPLYAEALLTLARSAGLTTVVDVGSGRGELLLALHRLDPSLRLVAVELADRPPGLPGVIEWRASLADYRDALLVANEWLDNVPVDVVVLTRAGPRVLLVDPRTGAEREGPEPAAPDLAWLDGWWPLVRIGDRAEVGLPRDEAWSGAVAALRAGIAVAVDYAHSRAERPAAGSLTGYRAGRQVPPVPDGSCDLTSHVALDACAAAGERAGATSTLLTTQRRALGALGVAGDLPGRALSRERPGAYLAALARAGQVAELRARGGLGDFGWLVQAVGADLPPLLLADQRDELGQL